VAADPAAAPGPTTDEESGSYWAALREHRVELQRCDACGRHRFPPMPSCPWCASTRYDVVASAGEGTVYSWVTVHRAFEPAWADEVPYTIAVVELDERCRLLGRVETDPDRLDAGLAVSPRFVDHDGWTELRFAPGGTG
jgi:uncharacterized OB-fold protein